MSARGRTRSELVQWAKGWKGWLGSCLSCVRRLGSVPVVNEQTSSSKTKYLPLNDGLYHYVCACRSNATDPILEALAEKNDSLGEEISKQQIGPDQGSLMTLLVAAIGASSAIEVGTFTGYSSICIARGLRPGGRLICLDLNQEWAEIGRPFWRQAGVEDRIDFRPGPALESLRKLEADLQFDFAFIDAAKTEYEEYYELLLPRIRRDGLILFDNMLWTGRVLGDLSDDPNGRAIDALNRKLPQDPRIESMLLAVADGILLCRKR
jgi:caffeoyl-CoA O-methyltransferase